MEMQKISVNYHLCHGKIDNPVKAVKCFSLFTGFPSIQSLGIDCLLSQSTHFSNRLAFYIATVYQLFPILSQSAQAILEEKENQIPLQFKIIDDFRPTNANSYQLPFEFEKVSFISSASDLEKAERLFHEKVV
jgi:hypothetical protein